MERKLLIIGGYSGGSNLRLSRTYCTEFANDPFQSFAGGIALRGRFQPLPRQSCQILPQPQRDRHMSFRASVVSTQSIDQSKVVMCIRVIRVSVEIGIEKLGCLFQ